MKLIRTAKIAALVGSVVGLVVGSVLIAVPPASAAVVPQTATVAAGTVTPLRLPDKPTIKPDIVPTATTDNCAAVVPHLADYAARGINQVACEKTVTTASTPAAHTGVGAVPAIGFPAACANNEWVAVRTEECNLNSIHIWTTYDAQTRVPTGTITYLISEDVRLSTTTSTITESVTFDYAGAVGPAAGLSTLVQWTSGCSAPCRITTVPTLTFSVPPTGSRTFTVNYQDTPSAQTPDTFKISHSYIALPPTFFLIGGADTPNVPLPIRCDNNTPGFTNPGCVVPSYPPNLILPLSKYAAAAVNAFIGENKLAKTPGLSAQTPLTRGDPVQTTPNRNITCANFFPFPINNAYGVVSDSCDEYPFASSQQSGGAKNIPGLQCLEIVAKQGANGVWDWVNLNAYDPNNPQACMRGHVNSVLNSLVGSQALNPLYTANRMMIGDPYTVQVTN